jgi:ABC-type branched-subunit amino acid transport system ATPase component
VAGVEVGSSGPAAATPPGARKVLELRHIECAYGGLRSVADVSLSVAPGEVVALVGPNGAGKTTLLNAVSGLVAMRGGQVLIDGEDVTALPAWRRARKGMARSFQLVRLFPDLTVGGNVQLGASGKNHPGFISSLLHFPSHRRFARGVAARAVEALQQVHLAEKAGDPGTALSHGQGRRVELARALVGQPKVLLLDEPTSGLHSGVIKDIVPVVKAAAASGMAVLLVEHNLKFVGEVAHRVIVLHHGEIIAEGSPAAIMRNPRVVEAYLGGAVGIRAQAAAGGA